MFTPPLFVGAFGPAGTGPVGGLGTLEALTGLLVYGLGWPSVGLAAPTPAGFGFDAAETTVLPEGTDLAVDAVLGLAGGAEIAF